MLYKLLNQDLTTHNGFQWEVGKTYNIDIDKPGKKLCTNQVFHAYRSPETAALFNPIHANISNPICYSVDTGKIVADDGLKVGVKSMRLVEQIKLPVFTARQQTIFAILCAQQARKYLTNPIPEWDKWADDYINNRSTNADAATYAAYATAAYAVAAVYPAAAANAAYAAATTADAATYAAAGDASYAYAAADAADATDEINFTSLAKKALTYEA